MSTIGIRSSTIHQTGLPATLSRTMMFQIGTKPCQPASPALAKMP